MYLIDTHVVSESRKGVHANPGVAAFFAHAERDKTSLYIAAVSIGDLRRGVDIIRHRGDIARAAVLEARFEIIMRRFADRVLLLDVWSAQIWGRLRVPDPHDVIDKQIAAIALVNGLTVVTRNTRHFLNTGVRILNPFSADPVNA